MWDRPVKIGRNDVIRVPGAPRGSQRGLRKPSPMSARVSLRLPSASFLHSIAICRKQCDYRLLCFAAVEAVSVRYHFEFDPVNRILRGRFEGQVTDELLKEYYGVAGEYFARTGARGAITDFSAVTSFEVSPQLIRELASSPPAILDQEFPRFIVAASPLIFGTARMFELAGQDTRPNLHVVRTMKEVCVILGVLDPKFEPIPD
jgi:6,7-dimethyl-8-ribityllumazine synthase